MTVLEQVYEVWNHHDVPRILGYFANDLEYRDQALGLRFTTRAELGAFLAETFKAAPDLNFEVTSAFEAGPLFAGEAVMRGTFENNLPGIPATGKAFEVYYGIIGELSDGKISRIVDYWNSPEFLGS